MNIKKLISTYYNKVPTSILKRYSPRNATIEPVAGCNLKCLSCPVNILRRPYGLLKIDAFKTIVDKLPHINSVLLYFMGEPLLNPDLPEMVKYLHDQGIRSIISTNGMFLEEMCGDLLDNGLSRLIMTLDGFTQETISAYRVGADFNQIIRGIDATARHREKNGSHIRLEVQTLVFKHNEHELNEIKNYVSTRSDKLTLVSPIISGWGGKVNEINIPSEKYSRIKAKPFSCPKILDIVITWEGDVLPCCYDSHGDFAYGNLLNESFEAVYWNDKGIQLRSMGNQRKLAPCKECYMFTSNTEVINFG